MFLDMDTDIDFWVSPREINEYIKRKQIPLEGDIGQKLFDEIASKRVVIHES